MKNLNFLCRFIGDLCCPTALADSVKGSAKADFSNDELEVPCVLIQGTGGNGDGRFYDIVLERRGKSFNYEMIFAEREDGDHVCRDGQLCHLYR